MVVSGSRITAEHVPIPSVVAPVMQLETTKQCLLATCKGVENGCMTKSGVDCQSFSVVAEKMQLTVRQKAGRA